MNSAISRNYARLLDSNRTQLKRSSLACTNTLVIFKMINNSILCSQLRFAVVIHTRLFQTVRMSLRRVESFFIPKKNYRYFINYKYQSTDDIGLVQDNIKERGSAAKASIEEA